MTREEDIENFGYGPYRTRFRNEHNNGHKMSWENLLFLEGLSAFENTNDSYDFLRDYSSVYNLFTASTPQPNPFSNRVMYIIDKLTKMGIKYTVDIFTYDGGNVFWGLGDNSTHKLVNIIAEPNPQATGPAMLFIAHHDVANVHSQNAQDNGASVCNLLKLASEVKSSPENLKRTIILFSDSEESGARGARQFAKKVKKNKDILPVIEHETYGQISAVINLELTGNGSVIWSDCENNKVQEDLHLSLEQVLGKSIPKLRTPPSDAIPFRHYNYPVLCIGILPEHDIVQKNTWRICHSINDNIDGCNRENMKDFTDFLFNLTKTTATTNHGNNNRTIETFKPLCT
jgi:hypothetical protein